MHSFAKTLVTSLLLFSAVASAVPGMHGPGRMHRLHKNSLRRRATNGKSQRCSAARNTTTTTSLGSESASSTSTSTTSQVAGTEPLTIATISTLLTLPLPTGTASTQAPPPPATSPATVDVLPTSLPRVAPPATSSPPEEPAAPQITSSPPSPGLSADAIESLEWHNVVRRQHNAIDLTWSDELASAAQRWASGCVFQHSGGVLGPYGENLAAGTSSSYSVENAVTAWTDEVSYYNPGNPEPSHYTQVVWRSTTQVGCAMVSGCQGIFSGSSARYYVCEYFPAGNVIGRFAENVQ